MKFIYVAFIIYTTFIIPVVLDCGCNKLKRDVAITSEEDADHVPHQISMAGEEYVNEEIPDDMSLIPGGSYMYVYFLLKNIPKPEIVVHKS